MLDQTVRDKFIGNKGRAQDFPLFYVYLLLKNHDVKFLSAELPNGTGMSSGTGSSNGSGDKTDSKYKERKDKEEKRRQQKLKEQADLLSTVAKSMVIEKSEDEKLIEIKKVEAYVAEKTQLQA